MIIPNCVLATVHGGVATTRDLILCCKFWLILPTVPLNDWSVWPYSAWSKTTIRLKSWYIDVNVRVSTGKFSIHSILWSLELHHHSFVRVRGTMIFWFICVIICGFYHNQCYYSAGLCSLDVGSALAKVNFKDFHKYQISCVNAHTSDSHINPLISTW